MKITIPKAILWMSIFTLLCTGGVSSVLAESSERGSNLTIQGSSTVPENTQSQYTVYFNGNRVSATWSLSSTTYAYINLTTGLLTARSVSTNQTVTVRASYRRNGSTYTTSKTVTITNTAATASLTGLSVKGPSSVSSGSSTPYSYTATAIFSNNTTQDVTSSASWSLNPQVGTISGGSYWPGTVTGNQPVTISATYTSGTVTRNGTMQVTVTPAGATGATGGKSINSTSQNRATLPSAPVAEQPLTTLSGFNIFSVNDLGMHCGDLDHRVASILPPYNVLHAWVIQKGTSTSNPKLLTSTDVDLFYSAVSNLQDPALQNPTGAPIYKTNFWDPSPLQPNISIAFDCYDPFYPPNILSMFALSKDMGLPAPDLDKLYPTTGTGTLTATQQSMPGVSSPYGANVPQAFTRFDGNFPFFVNFPFGYRQLAVNWFAADGIPLSPIDDFGRTNSFPLMRVQARTKTTALTGSSGQIIASMDAVVPVSGETSCYKCHTSSVDGGGGYAADVAFGGSPRSGTKFTVAVAANDTSNNPAAVKREWAADMNIIRLHDAKYGTTLQTANPVSCQVCHYTPALDLAHKGPLGPGDAGANTRDQKVHKSNSRVMHSFHGQFTDLFPNMPPPSDSRRKDSTGKLTVNAFVTGILNQTCYQCHPGANTKCLRGAMFTGGMICNDCHGSLAQVGNDFSVKFSKANPGVQDLSKRVPWVNEPHCQSCHTGDAMNNKANDPNVIKAPDGIRLLQAYLTNDADAKPIVADKNKRFAEETAPISTQYGDNTVLYRFSKGHSGISCQACHGSTHAEWPVQPESGTYVANDNMAAIQIQGHTGTITECTACHTAGSLPVSLGGPHGMHPVGDSKFISGHESLVSANRAQCQACHGLTGQGTVLSRVSVNRTVGSRTFTKGEQISCGRCHSNPL
jgi:hypothetical protein